MSLADKKIATKLYVLVTVLTTLMIVIGVYGVKNLRTLYWNSESLYQDRVMALQQLTEIRYLYTAEIIKVAEELETTRQNSGKAKAIIENAQIEIDRIWKIYLKTSLTAEEEKLIQETEMLFPKIDNALTNLKAKIDITSDEEMAALVDNNIYLALNPLILKLNQLIELQITVSNELHLHSERLYNESKKNIWILLVIAIIVSGTLSYFIIENANSLLQALKNSNIQAKAAEEKYKAFIRFAGDAIFIISESLNIVDINEAAIKLSGYSHEALTSLKITDLLLLNENEIKVAAQSTVNQDPAILHEYQLLNKDRSIVDTEANIRLLEGIGYIIIIRDITTRKKAEMQIRESEEKYRYLFQNNPACIIIWNLENLYVLEVNDKVLNTYGYSKEEWAKMNIVNIRPNEDQQTIRDFAQLMINSSEPIARRTWRHLKKNGEEMLMEITSHKIIYKNQKAILSLGNDITNQVKTELALRKSEEEFRILIDHAADAIIMVNGEGRIFDLNQSAVDLFHYSRNELLKMYIYQLFESKQEVDFKKTWEILQQKRTLTNETKIRTINDELIDVEVSRKMLPDSNNAISIVRNITDRKAAEEKLKRSELNYRQLFEKNPTPIWVLEENSLRFLQVNKACIDKYGYSEAEFMRMTYNNLLIESSLSHHYDFIDTKSRLKSQIHLKKSGDAIFMETTSIPITLDGVPCILMIAIDVTEKTRYEQRIAMASIKAQEDERYEIGGELHDNVCQILTASLLFLSMLKKNIPPESKEHYDKTQQYITLATKEIRSLSHRLAPSFFDDTTLESAIAYLLKNFNIEEKYQIELNYDESARSKPIIKDVQLNMYRILQEQLKNIVQHAEATKIKIEVFTEADELVMRTSDNGLGFNTVKQETGIGIANMKRRTQLMEGTMQINSTPQKGTVIEVKIPLKDFEELDRD